MTSLKAGMMTLIVFALTIVVSPGFVPTRSAGSQKNNVPTRRSLNCRAATPAGRGRHAGEGQDSRSQRARATRPRTASINSSVRNGLENHLATPSSAESIP